MNDDFPLRLPRKFTEVIQGAFRDDGRRWIESLPLIISEIAENWSVEISKNPFPNLSYHYVVPCVCADGRRAVVKIGFPGEAKAIRSEAETLKFLDGDGAVNLLRFDERRFAMLLERLEPGENLKQVCRGDDQRAVDIAIGAMRKFWREPPANHDVPTLEEWFEGLKRAEKINFAPEHVAKARKFFEELNSSPTSRVLLHGDFHHENILSATREPFLAIDPKGIVGDAAYDITVFLINHASWLRRSGATDLDRKMDETVRRFAAAFAFEPINLRKWTYAFCVLSAFWTFEENCENWKKELARTEIWQV
jgi:streptomycin 6-kinase